MNISKSQTKVLLRPEDFDPLCPQCEVIGSFNPAAARYNGDILLLVRVVERPKNQDPDTLLSPRAVWNNGQVDWKLDIINSSGTEDKDPRLFRLPDGRVRLRYISHLRLARLDEHGTKVREILSLPDLLPQRPWEEFGIEDPRITLIDDTFYITYVAISRKMGITTALMTTKDFQTYNRLGIIFPTENKDVVLLPKRVNGQFVALHRPMSNHWIDSPSIEAAFSPDAFYWGDHQFLLGPRPGHWDSYKIGAGPPPLLLPQGWLLVYHGVTSPTAENPGGIYSVGAALLDKNDPLRVLSRPAEPMLRPTHSVEKHGFLPNVIFPSGALLSVDEKDLLIFAGAADEVTELIKIPMDTILSYLETE